MTEPDLPTRLARKWCPNANKHYLDNTPDNCQCARIDGAVREVLDDALWLLEFIVEPEWFPNEGDRQFWQERVRSIAALYK